MRFKTLNLTLLLILFGFGSITLYLYDSYIRHKAAASLIESVRHTMYDLALLLNSAKEDAAIKNPHALLVQTKMSSPLLKELCIMDEKGRKLVTTERAKGTIAISKPVRLDRLNSESLRTSDAVYTLIYHFGEREQEPFRLCGILRRSYIEHYIKRTRLAHLLLPALFLLLFLLFYLFYIHRMIIRPILQIDAYLRGKTPLPPHSRIREIEHLSQSLQRQLHKLQSLAYFDTLTKLPNRRHIERSLDMAIASAKRDRSGFGIALLDLDRFKEVNDTLGHEMGDKLLRYVTDTLREHLRKVDQVGRLGGDEFLILFHQDKHEEQILRALERIRTLFDKNISLDGKEIRSTVSIGVAFFPRNGETKEELIKKADQAMYRAKARGGNRIASAP